MDDVGQRLKVALADRYTVDSEVGAARPVLMAETLAWLDRYLGPVN